MPLGAKIDFPEGSVAYFWKLTESVATLVERCREFGVSLRADEMRCHENRLREKLAEVLLIRHIFGEEVALGHTDAGAPMVDIEGCHISISHTQGWVCIARNDSHRMGIDVESSGRDRVLRVRERFLDSEELQSVPDGDVEANLLAWTAKEALYKLFAGKGGESLNEHYGIEGAVKLLAGGMAMRGATAVCLPGERLVVFSKVLPDAVVSLAVEAKFCSALEL